MKRAKNHLLSVIWYFLKSFDRNLLVYGFGATETDSPARNDSDGDGRTDAAVWRETDGVFTF